MLRPCSTTTVLSSHILCNILWDTKVHIVFFIYFPTPAPTLPLDVTADSVFYPGLPWATPLPASSPGVAQGTALLTPPPCLDALILPLISLGYNDPHMLSSPGIMSSQSSSWQSQLLPTCLISEAKQWELHMRYALSLSGLEQVIYVQFFFRKCSQMYRCRNILLENV